MARDNQYGKRLSVEMNMNGNEITDPQMFFSQPIFSPPYSLSPSALGLARAIGFLPCRRVGLIASLVTDALPAKGEGLRYFHGPPLISLRVQYILVQL